MDGARLLTFHHSNIPIDHRSQWLVAVGMSEHLAERLQNHLSQLMPEAMQWLHSMVDINSFTANAAGVSELGKLTASCFATLGFKGELVPSTEEGHGPHLIMSRGDAARLPVVLVTHLDTVFPPEEETRNDFRWQESAAERRIYGPGTVDIKGGTVLIWMMLHAMRELMPEVYERTHFVLAANAAEEVISADFANALTERFPGGARAVLVFEGGPRVGEQWHLVTSRKGRAEYRIDSSGKAAHAGSSHAAGTNAIVGLCGAVMKAAALTDYDKDLTVNVGRMSGGTVLNRVPHEAFAELEMRAFDPALLQATGDAVMALARPLGAESAINVQRIGLTPAWKEDASTKALAAHWHAAASMVGRELVSVSRGGLSDANYLCHLGPTLDGLGPSGGNAHCSERSADGSKVPEFVETDTFVPKAVLNALALTGLLNS